MLYCTSLLYYTNLPTVSGNTPPIENPPCPCKSPLPMKTHLPVQKHLPANPLCHIAEMSGQNRKCDPLTGGPVKGPHCLACAHFWQSWSSRGG